MNTTSGASREVPPTGAPITVVKLRPDATEATRYPAEVLPSPAGWLVARAPWTRDRLDLGYLVFEPGDVFVEYFSLEQPFNFFGLYAEDGTFKGWYCNVSHPSWLEDHCVFWHDLYVDVIVQPDGETLVLDQDELEAAGVADKNSRLYRHILEARDTLLDMAHQRAYPFSEAPVPPDVR